LKRFELLIYICQKKLYETIFFMENNPTVDRRLQIMKYLEVDEKVDVGALSRQFGVSEVTVRKDLRHLEEKNLLIRSRGGAMKQGLVDMDLNIFERRKQNMDKKLKIGKAAAAMIGDGETIILDSGTTIMELAKNISKQIETTIITIAVDIACRLAEYPKLRVIMPGGILRRNSLSTVGERAASFLNDFHCDKFFLSADGLDMEQGLLTMNIEEAHLARICIENSNQVIALIDSGKLQKTGIMTIAPLSKIDLIITDSGITDDQVNLLRSRNVKLMIIE
jgi:DeoR family transcriptional regulator, aga operon transcriptional repressor